MRKFIEKIKKCLENIKNFFIDKVFVKLDKFFDFLKEKLGINRFAEFYRKKFKNKTKKAIAGYLFILPFIIGTIIFGGQPIFKSIRMSLAEFAGTKVIDEAPVFLIEGFSFTQFISIFKNNPTHVEAIISVFKDVMIVVPLVLVFSLILSLLLNTKLKGIKVFRMIFFIPVILLSGNLLTYFESYGLLNVPALSSTGLQETLTFYLPEAITEIIMAAFSKVILLLWLGGVQTLIFLSALQKTDKPIYEAATIDGASGWEIFWKITFPQLVPMMILNVVYTTVIYTNLGNELTAIIQSTIVSGDFGRDYSSALSWVLFGLELVVIGIYTLILKLTDKHYQ